MRRYARHTLSLLAALLLTVLAVRGVAAHANYERSDPAANAILEKAPDQIKVWFSEEPEPRFSEIEVLDAQRRRVDKGDVAGVSGDPRALSIGLGDLAPGTYTVVWKTLSTVDGHTTRGAFPITVGLDQIPAPMLIPTGVGVDSGGASPWSVASRWLNLLTAVVVAGAFLFLPLVLGTALRATSGGDASALAAAWGVGRRRGLLVAVVAAGAGLLAGVFALLVQAGVAAGVEPWAAIGPPVATLLGTRYGMVWGGRMLLLVALGALALYLRRPGATARDPLWWVGGALSALLLFTQSLNSHAAAAQQWVAVAVAADWLHLVATTIWIGGLVQLVLALPATLAALPKGLPGRVLANTIPRFSIGAMLAVGVLVITGLYQTWLEVGSWEALSSTAYGQALLVKLALLLPLLVLGALNLLVLSPRVASAVSRGSRAAVDRLGALQRRFGLVVYAEVLLGVAILGVVGVLTSLEPARDALRSQGITRSVQAEDVRAVLRVAPGEAGLNTIDVGLSANGQPLADAQRVTLRFTHQQMDMGTTEERLEPVGDGHYRGMSGALAMAGGWVVEVIVRRAGREDVKADVQLAATDPGTARNQPGVPAVGGGQPPPRLIVGAVLIAIGVLFLVGAIQPGRRRRHQTATVALGSLAVLIGGGLATIAALYPVAVDVVIPNPVVATPASVDRGQELYQASCTACHGLNGRGDGPLAATLNPRPADLRIHVAQHTEGQLWLWISDGVPGSAMPSFRQVLSDDDRWNVINYLESQFGSARTASVQ